MSNFAEDIEAVAGGEPIEAVTYRDKRGWAEGTGEAFGPLPWDGARPVFDYEYHTGYGGSDCHPIWVWTPTRVIFVSVYDGATDIEAVPRHPTPGYETASTWPVKHPSLVGGE